MCHQYRAHQVCRQLIDLHLHSHYSDGTWSPADLVEHAVTLGMSCIALTDHDTTSGIAQALAAAAGRLSIIDGVEINTLFYDKDGAHDVHILGYGIDLDAPVLQALLAQQQAARIEQMRASCEAIRKAGVDITYEQVAALSGRGAVGKAHLTEAIVQVGGARDVMDAYTRFTAKSSPCFVERKSTDPFSAVKAIVSAGGIASIAHPGSESYVEPLLKELIDAGLGAIEVYHRIHDDATRQRYREFASANAVLITGGSDCHGPYRASDTEFYPSMMGEIVLPASDFAALQNALSAKSLAKN